LSPEAIADAAAGGKTEVVEVDIVTEITVGEEDEE
jgi:hypothetical protein